MLEAMATGTPVIATRWGGPADYLDASCGLLVEPSSREALIQGLAGAMQKLIAEPGLGRRFGNQGKRAHSTEF